MTLRKQLLILSLPLAMAAGARTLSPAEALSRTAGADVPYRVKSAANAQPRLVKTVDAADGQPAIYGFESPRGGYLIVSADDCAEPLLGYSDAGKIEADSLNPALQWWLGEYARQIEWQRSSQETGTAVAFPRTVPAGRTAVEPLIKSHWDQGQPYNAQCPSYDGERTWTGCVATAMAQVMNYWQYPEKGTGSISYDASSISKRLSLNFSLKKFDWANMLDDYEGTYTDAQASAVAYLMKAAGYSVKMDYGLDASGALAMNIRKALIKYFGYDKNISHELRQLYTATEWNDIIYKSVSEGCPVLYGGGSMIGGGHSFICDGYDGDGYFHFNWGWTGMSDGYFLLDALNPYALGAGGGGGGGYNFTQDAVVGVQPPTGKPEETRPLTLVQTGSLAAYQRNDSICFDLFAENGPMWVNYNPETLKFNLGAIVEKVGDNNFAPRSVQVDPILFTLEAGYGTGPMYFTPGIPKASLDLPDGTYRFTMAIKHDGTDEYIPVKCNRGYSNFATVIKNGSKYTFANEDVYRLEVTDAKLLHDLYYGMATEVSATIRNDSPIEMTRGFAPVIIADGSVALLGESIYVTVKPGEEVTRTWATNLYQLSQYFNVQEDKKVIFTLFDESTYNMWNDDVFQTLTLHPNPGNPGISTRREPEIVGADVDDDGIYIVEDPKAIEISAPMAFTGGIFGYELLAFVVNDDMSIEATSGEITFLDKTAMFYFNTTLSLPKAEPGKKYNLMMGYSRGGSYMAIGPHTTEFKVADSAGVDNVAVDNTILFDGSTVTAPGQCIEVYTVAGAKVMKAFDKADVSNLTDGIYIVRAGKDTIKVKL